MSKRIIALLSSRTALCILAVLCIAFGIALTLRSRDAGVLAACGRSDNKPVCYSGQIQSILRARGIPAAFDALALAYDYDPDFAATCHAVTHELGKAAYEEFKSKGETELTDKASYCGYGYYHGFLDALLVDTNDLTEARAFCTYVGQHVPNSPAPEFAEGACYHGVGHGITDGTDPREWGSELSIVRPGLALCTRVSGGNREWERRCASGVFNALGNMYGSPKYGLHPSADPYALCRTRGLSEIAVEACYDQMNTQAAALGHNDLASIIAFTSRIQNATYRDIALHGAMGFYVQILKRHQQNLSVTDMNRCEGLPSDGQWNCVNGLIGGVFEFGSPGKQDKEVLAVCSSAELKSPLRQTCFESLLQDAAMFEGAAAVKSLCGVVPQAYRSICGV